MQKSYRFLVSILFLGSYLLSACSGVVVPQQDDSPGSPSSSQSAEAVFTGTIESMDGTQWLISGQLVNVDDATSVDPNVQVGDIVKVEAGVSADGSVIAFKIETSGPDDVNANDNVANDNSSNANDNTGNDNGSNTNDNNANTNTNDNTNSANDNGNVNSNDNSAPSGPEQEAFGAVEAITTDSITIDGITYKIADFTEFKTLIAVGDQVKIHIIVNADGTFTIREIEKFSGTSIGNDNSNSSDDNSNLNGNDNGSDDNSNSNSNDDDEHDDDNSNSNSNGG